jgi:ectoine hydroxylase-related dioxygenase (phytanoyl-CoA dioxygenase family)
MLCAMQIAEALAQLGVRDDTLSADEKLFLDENGYLVLPGILSGEQLADLRERFAELLAEEGDEAGKEVHQEAGTDRLADLVNKGQVFDVTYTHPRVLAGIAHVLNGDLKLSSLNARFAKPGEGLQGLHADWDRLERAGDFQVCNSIWLLDDFTEQNGATRLVPGSHRRGTEMPEDHMADTTAPHPDERLLIAPAGTVVVFNSHTWHGGTRNETSNSRRAMHAYYCRRNVAQQLDQRKYIRAETRRRLSDAALTVLGLDD